MEENKVDKEEFVVIPSEEKAEFEGSVSIKERVRNWIKNHRRLSVFFGIVLILILLCILILNSSLKYPVLSKFVKAEAEVQIIDAQSGLPVSEARVEISGQGGVTGKDGIIKLGNITLANQKLVVRKQEYKDFEREEFIKTGLNKLDSVKLQSNINYAYFSVKNQIGDTYIEGAEVEMDGERSMTDADGLVRIRTRGEETGKKGIHVSKTSFIDLTAEVNLDKQSKVIPIHIVPQGNHYFLSNRSGKVDLYKSNIDGSEQTVILEGTGSEDSNTSIFVSPTNEWIALYSTRNGLRTSNGSLIPEIFLINPSTKSVGKISSDNSSLILGWNGNNLVFVTDNGELGNSRITKLVSYNINTKQYLEVASANSIYARLLGDNIFYSQMDPEDPASNGTYFVKVGDLNKTKISNGVTFQIFATDVQSITFSTTESDAWYTYNLESKKLERLIGMPPFLINKYYFSSADKSKTAFLDTRDGKTDLYIKGGGEKEIKLTNIGAVNMPVTWIGNEYLLFLVSRQNETADYVINIKGGEAQKVSDIFAGRQGIIN